MNASLPPDIILLICEELGNLQEFPTLFNCAVSGKQLAGSALLWMYRIHTYSPVRDPERDEAEIPKTGETKNLTFTARDSQQRRTVSKWASQWRSIILSSLGKTAYPYCLYIRSLELSNLSDLFGDTRFGYCQDRFFAGEMAIFLKTLETPMKYKGKGRRPNVPRLAVTPILDLVGESICKFAGESATNYGGTVALEQLSGHIERAALPMWVARLSRLKSLILWDGAVLDEYTGDVIRANCRDFDSLDMFVCSGYQADADFSSFLAGLGPNTMRFLQMISSNSFGAQTLLSLSSHGESLRELRLGSLGGEAIRSLSLLKGCTALNTLMLEDAEGIVNLETTENDVFLEVLHWLTSCSQLTNIQLKNFVNGPAILTSVCLEEKIKLKQLDLLGYVLVGNQDFHRALSHQVSLESLYLKADAEESFRDDIDTLVSSLCKLTNLTYLDINDTSDYFRSAEVQRLAKSLTKLENVTLSGYGMDDSIWPSISTLSNLRSLSFQAMTSFTYDGILQYISTLQPNNSGLELSIMCATTESKLSGDEENAIKRVLADKVDGKFQFVLHREADSEFGSDSD